MTIIRQQKPICLFQTCDNRGYINCLAIDGTVGLCKFNLCPRRHLWRTREVPLKIECNFEPFLLEGEVKCNSKLKMK